MQLVLDTKGLHLDRKRGSFHVGKDGEGRLFSPHKVSSIAITADVSVTANAVRLAVESGIPILFFNRIGKAEALLWSPYFEGLATLRRLQARFVERPDATAWMIEVFKLKTHYQIANLRSLIHRPHADPSSLQRAIGQMAHYSRQLPSYTSGVVSDVRHQIMGVEGSIARAYFQAISGALPLAYRFAKRSRQPAKDMFNALLNYVYGMMYTVVEAAIFAAGLDPHLGIFHADSPQKPTLAFDLIEPFRPWADNLVIDMCCHEEVERRYFNDSHSGTFLNKEGKAFLIPKFHAWLGAPRVEDGRELSVRNHVHRLAGMLASRIRASGDGPPDPLSDGPYKHTTGQSF